MQEEVAWSYGCLCTQRAKSDHQAHDYVAIGLGDRQKDDIIQGVECSDGHYLISKTYSYVQNLHSLHLPVANSKHAWNVYVENNV